MRLCMVERRVTIACGRGEVVKGKGHQQRHRRVSCRSVLIAVLVLGVVSPSLLSLGGGAICRSMNCLWWRFGRGSFGGSRSQLLNLHHNIELARLRESVSRHLASIDIPKSMHCLSLILMEEYYRNAMARSPVPPPEYVSHLNNHSFIHLALLTDNVLAAAVVVSSTIKSSANPENLVFHIVTDKKLYAAMHSWFALNPMFPAVVEVRGLHQFEWPSHVSASIMETVKIHQISWDHSYHRRYNDKYQRLEALRPSSQSLLNYLVIHLPVNHESGFAFWRLGSSLPPALIAFEGHTYSILPLWHLWGLGHRLPEDDELLRSSAVLHFSGPAKPWLQIGFPVLRNLWHAHVNLSNEFVKSCGDPE